MSGRHLKFPFRIGADGRPETPADLPEHVKGEVVQLLLTNPGERDMQPTFGGGLRRLIFEANDDVTAGLARARLTRALSFWLGERLELVSLDTRADESTLRVDLAYRLAPGAEPQRLRFEHNLGAIGDG
ncbi:MAG: GPW/gp25 family protein [Pseudomonadota bacterium]